MRDRCRMCRLGVSDSLSRSADIKSGPGQRAAQFFRSVLYLRALSNKVHLLDIAAPLATILNNIVALRVGRDLLDLHCLFAFEAAQKRNQRAFVIIQMINWHPSWPFILPSARSPTKRSRQLSHQVGKNRRKQRGRSFSLGRDAPALAGQIPALYQINPAFIVVAIKKTYRMTSARQLELEPSSQLVPPV